METGSHGAKKPTQKTPVHVEKVVRSLEVPFAGLKHLGPNPTLTISRSPSKSTETLS